MKHKAAVFDLYDTLIDNPFRSEEARRELSETAALLGVPEQEFMRGWSETFPRRETGGFATMEDNLEHIVRSAGGRVDAARIKAAADSRLEFTRRNFILLPGAVEMLARLKATGRTIGLISNCGSLIPLIWRGTPLAPLVDAPVFSFSAGLRKPDPRIYSLACELLAVLPEDCLYVGDGGDGELTGASRAGMDAVLVHAPAVDLNDGRHDDARGWTGPRVSALSEVLGLVE